MLNYGEALAYWYFRLNGFVPMANFVLHRGVVSSDSDCDLIAVRFPHVYEEIGGQEEDWDIPFLQQIGRADGKVLACFVQVKAGRDGDNVGRIREYFDRHSLALVRRLGIWPIRQSAAIAESLQGAAVLTEGNFVLSKVTILRTLRERNEVANWIELSLEHVIHFVMNRMKKYAREKSTARMHFPDLIIQFMADVANTREYQWPRQNPGLFDSPE